MTLHFSRFACLLNTQAHGKDLLTRLCFIHDNVISISPIGREKGRILSPPPHPTTPHALKMHAPMIDANHGLGIIWITLQPSDYKWPFPPTLLSDLQNNKLLAREPVCYLSTTLSSNAAIKPGISTRTPSPIRSAALYSGCMQMVKPTEGVTAPFF